MKQTIDISPEKVAPIASTGIRFLALETTLIPGNIKQQLAVLEVLLSGLATGELVLATPPRAPVESDVKKDGAGEEPEKVPGPTSAEIEQFRLAGLRTSTVESRTGAGDEESG